MSAAGPNPYQSPLAVGYEPLVAAFAAESERVEFIRRTYAHLMGAIFAFAALETAIFLLTPEPVLRSALALAGGWGWLIFLGGFLVVSWVARVWAESTTSVPVQYAGLALYVAAQAILFVPLLFLASLVNPVIVPSAGIVTLVIFGGLTFSVFVTRADFSWMRSMLWLGGLAALGVIICAIVFQFELGWIFSLAMILLASGYILYDTSNVLHHYRTDQHVAAALALFASVALLFWYVLRIMIALSGRD